MKKVTRNEVDFSEIFEFADKKFGIDWNRANDMFFNNSLDYKFYNEYSLGEPLDYIDKNKPYEELEESDKGYFIINEFMKEKNIDSVWVDNT